MTGFSWKFFYALLTLLFFLLTSFSLATNGEGVKCLERERKALLSFKQGIQQDDSSMLSTWREDENEDCCNWNRVHCSNETSHVQILDLYASFSPSDSTYLKGIINITLLIELHDLQYLDLSDNQFYPSEIPESIESFTNLIYLNLSYSGVIGSIPSQLGRLSNLQYIDLGGNYLDGAIPCQFGNLSRLQYLNLRGNNLVGVIPHHLGNLSILHTLQLGGYFSNLTVGNQNKYDAEWLSKLSSLSNLDLSYVGDVGYSYHWLHMIAKLPNLKELRLIKCGIFYAQSLSLIASASNYSSSLVILDLSLNDLNSALFQWPFNFSSNLQELYLENCNISANNLSFLFSHFHFPSLNVLDLSQNNLMSVSVLNFSSNLQKLYLSECNLSVTNILFSHFHFSSLNVLDLTYNNLMSISALNFSSNLQKLYLRACNISATNLLFSDFHFPSLIVLDLSYSSLMSIRALNFNSNLQELYLSNCSLSSSNLLFPSFDPNLTSLVKLDLSLNLLTSSTIFYWISNFTFNLHEIDLHDNLLRGSIPDSFGIIMNSIEVLDVSNNKLQGEIPTSLGTICTLKSLDLSYNNWSGKLSSFIHNTSWCSRHSLQRLYLSGNQITGMLPNLSVFSILEHLDLSDNQLKGEIPESIGLLSQLTFLSLGQNNWRGVITETHFRNLSNLKILSLSSNSLLTMRISTSWVPPFQIQDLVMHSCMMGPNFPNWLHNQQKLSLLYISNVGLSSSTPEWFWPLLENMESIDISSNNLYGEIPNLPLKLIYWPSINLTSNNFEGAVPSFFTQASTLYLSKNKFSNLDPLVCGQTKEEGLTILDISNNQLEGQLPDCWSHLKSLQFVDLSNNYLSGEITPSIGHLMSIEALILRNNSLIGELPSSFMNCSNLLLLDLSENKLMGSIPSWIGESLRQLQILSLRMNHLYGNLPLHLCHLTQIRLLDLSHNNLFNEIPSCLKNYVVMAQERINSTKNTGHQLMSNTTGGRGRGTNYFYIEFYIRLVWKGADSLFQRPEFFLKSIDLSSNTLSGEIPKEFVSLLGLVSLNLSRNQLSGKIPMEIGKLESLEFLDLSRNKLSGPIPPSLAQIHRVSVLDLSNNYLSGQIPAGTQLQSFNASSYEGNLNLCGLPLDKRCLEDEMPSPKVFDHYEDNNTLCSQEFYLSLGLGFTVGFWAFTGPLLFNNAWRQAYYRFVNKITNRVQVMVAIYVAKYLTNRD